VSSDPAPEPDAIDRYLLLIDISGYTGFLAGVADAHGEDFSTGLPAGYRVLGELLQGLVEGLPPYFQSVKLEGDAVFGAASASELDGQGMAVIDHLAGLYRTFAALRDVLARSATDDKCAGCFAVTRLDIKMVLHRGLAVRQQVGSSTDLFGPAVNVAHRLLKNTVRDQWGNRPYLLLTQTAASNLGQPDVGTTHSEQYGDVGAIDTRIVDLADAAGVDFRTWPAPPKGSEDWPQIALSRS
jgi:class 3 adenylate cyclase